MPRRRTKSLPRSQIGWANADLLALPRHVGRLSMVRVVGTLRDLYHAHSGFSRSRLGRVVAGRPLPISSQWAYAALAQLKKRVR